MIYLSLRLPPSVNHCHKNVTLKSKDGKAYNSRQLTDEARAWLEECAIRAQVARKRTGWETRTKGEKVVVEIRAFWPDARRRDMHNLHKLIADGLEKQIFVDDQWALLRDMDWEIDRKHPRLELTIFDHEGR